MITVIAGKNGRVHHAGNPFLQKTRPTYCFVPEEFFHGRTIDFARYLASRWPSINCSANPNGIGSHVIPDPQKSVSSRTRCPVLQEFLWRLEIVATVKTVTLE